MDFLNTFYGIFLNINWAEVFFYVKIIFIFIDILLLAGIIFVFGKALEFRPKFNVSKKVATKSSLLDSEDLRKRWDLILKQSENNPPHSFTVSIIEADKFVDEILKKMGLPGEHMADRLERLNYDNLKSLDRLWRVHRIRNEIVHSPDFDISSVDAKEILATYEVFLRELGAF